MAKISISLPALYQPGEHEILQKQYLCLSTCAPSHLGPSLSSCTDYSWSDSKGRNCSTYVLRNYCNLNGSYGLGWAVDGNGFFTQYASDGRDALTACCGCGGGISGCSVSASVGTSSVENY